jgi:hypothetical protein
VRLPEKPLGEPHIHLSARYISRKGLPCTCKKATESRPPLLLTPCDVLERISRGAGVQGDKRSVEQESSETGKTPLSCYTVYDIHKNI